MKYTEINVAMAHIAEVRNQLSAATSETDRGKISDKLEALELDFMANHGGILNEVLMDVHDEYTPDTEVMPINHYFANKYLVVGTNEFGKAYDVTVDDGLYVDIDDFPGKNTKFVFLPNPLRLVLNIDENDRRLVWNAQKPSYVM